MASFGMVLLLATPRTLPCRYEFCSRRILVEDDDGRCLRRSVAYIMTLVSITTYEHIFQYHELCQKMSDLEGRFGWTYLRGVDYTEHTQSLLLRDRIRSGTSDRL